MIYHMGLWIETASFTFTHTQREKDSRINSLFFGLPNNKERRNVMGLMANGLVFFGNSLRKSCEDFFFFFFENEKVVKTDHWRVSKKNIYSVINWYESGVITNITHYF